MFATARSCLVASTLLLLAACGGAPAPEDAGDKARLEAEALGRDTDDTVFDDMIDTQDRARDVEDLTLGRKDELEQAMDASEGDGPAEDE